jgi:hypothetical protein
MNPDRTPVLPFDIVSLLLDTIPPTNRVIKWVVLVMKYNSIILKKNRRCYLPFHTRLSTKHRTKIREENTTQKLKRVTRTPPRKKSEEPR